MEPQSDSKDKVQVIMGMGTFYSQPERVEGILFLLTEKWKK